MLAALALTAWLWSERRVQSATVHASLAKSSLQAEVAGLQQHVASLELQLDREGLTHHQSLQEKSQALDTCHAERRNEEEELRHVLGRVAALEQKEQSLQTSVDAEKQLNISLQLALEAERATALTARDELTRLQSTLDNTKDKLSFLDDARKQLGEQMKLITAEALEQNGKRMTEQHQEKLTHLLAPVKEKFELFSKKVEETELARAKEQGQLGAQLQELMKASSELDKGARDLTKALTGDNKVAGNWGELILERVLESAGLQENREYVTQQTEKDEEGNRLRPDVVVRLPEQKNLVIDAKVSLKPWAAYASNPSGVAWTAVVASMRAHVHVLAKKNYAALYGLASVDFVLLFVPAEATFLELVRQESNVLQEAWEKRVMIVGPSNLLWALRMVASLWRFENQGQNAQEIARQAGDMYDKFVGFVDDLEKVGKALNSAVSSYNGARGKLEVGRGDLISRAQRLRNLGVSSKKSLPEKAFTADYAVGVPLVEGLS